MERKLDADEIWGLIDYHGREIRDICDWISTDLSGERRAAERYKNKRAELERHFAAIMSLKQQAKAAEVQL